MVLRMTNSSFFDDPVILLIQGINVISRILNQLFYQLSLVDSTAHQ